MSEDYYNQGDRGEGLGSWIPTIIMLFCFPPVGILMLLHKVFSGGRRRESRPRYRGVHPQDLQRAGVGPAEVQPPPRGRVRNRRTRERADRGDRSKGFIAGGTTMAAVFGFAALNEFLDALAYGTLQYSLSDIFVPLGFCGAGLILLYHGLTKKRQAKRFHQYLSLIGKHTSVTVASLAQAAGQPVRRVVEDLQDMLDTGIIPQGYLDVGAGKLFLTDEGIQEEPEKKEKAPAGMERENATLLEIRQVNDSISDPVMSRKIDRIGEITGKIFAYLREKPDQESQLRSFLSYYLPTTLKILRAYAQMESQGIEGENISAAKARIEGMMDKVVDGFEKQLDRLFQSDALDITSDVAVLEQMLKKDGLGKNEGMTLGG